LVDFISEQAPIAAMREHLETLVHICEEQLRVLDAERSAIVAELRDYRQMLAADANPDQEESRTKSIEKWLGNLSPTWLAILARLAGYTRFGASDVVLASNELHRLHEAVKQQSPGNARFQLSAYTKKKLIERLGGGNYRLTDKCRASLDLLREERLRLASLRPANSSQNKVWARAGGSGPRTAGDAR
jgi:hypothetical protein